MWCEVYEIGGMSQKKCEIAIRDGVKACVMCDGAGLVSYPDPIPDCKCGRKANHYGSCADRNLFFDAYREPTEEEKQYIANRLGGMSPIKALQNSELPDTNKPSLKAKRLEQMPHIRRYLVEVLENEGISDELIAQTIKDGLTATITRVRKTGDKDAPFIEISDADWQARARFVEIALRSKGYLDKADRGYQPPSNITVINKLSLKGRVDEQVIDGEVVDG